MAKLARELIIPKREGMAFEVLKGQVLRVTAFEGKQVADMTSLNLRDLRETFSSHITAQANRSFRNAKQLYSAPPFYTPMFTVLEDKVGANWIHGRCTKMYYTNDPGHPNCQDNIAGALKPYGLEEYQVPVGTFNIFMKVNVGPDGRYAVEDVDVKKGDYTDLRAEIDNLVAISACPDGGLMNGFEDKPLKVQIFDSL